MKLCIRQLMLLSVTALLCVGCSGDGQPPAENGTDAGKAPAETETPVVTPDTEPAEADLGDPAPGTAVAGQGDPGSIQGVVKSPYTRLAQGAVYIVRVDGQKFPPPKDAEMDQKNLIFVPHVLPILVGTTVDFPNSDTVRHNVYSTEGSIQDFNLGTYDVGIVKHITFDKVGVTHLGCNVHTEMSAYILTCQNPYFAVTDKGTGKFAIPEVPPGNWHLRFFHERLKPKTIQVEVKPGEEASVEFTDLKRK